MKFRSNLAAVVAVAAVVAGAWTLQGPVGAFGSNESTFVPVTPVRILDTRDPVDLGLAGPFVSAIPQDLRVTGTIATDSGQRTVVPIGASGVVLNVTVVQPTADGFLSVRPADAVGAPATSSLNFEAGAIVPNSVTVNVPTSGPDVGAIEITYDAFGTPGPTTDVLVDLLGYHLTGSLQEIAAQIAELEAVVAGKADRTAVQSALAGKADRGPITMTHGGNGWTKTPENFANSLPFTHVETSTGSRFNGTAGVVRELQGPSSLGGSSYTLARVTYCAVIASGGRIDHAVVNGYTLDDVAFVVDGAKRETSGCYEIVLPAAVRAHGQWTIALQIEGTGDVWMRGLTTHWVERG
jgi:hypothetical protein